MVTGASGEESTLLRLPESLRLDGLDVDDLGNVRTDATAAASSARSSSASSGKLTAIALGRGGGIMICLSR